jgi:hypothetical protein
MPGLVPGIHVMAAAIRIARYAGAIRIAVGTTVDVMAATSAAMTTFGE